MRHNFAKQDHNDRAGRRTGLMELSRHQETKRARYRVSWSIGHEGARRTDSMTIEYRRIDTVEALIRRRIAPGAAHRVVIHALEQVFVRNLWTVKCRWFDEIRGRHMIGWQRLTLEVPIRTTKLALIEMLIAELDLTRPHRRDHAILEIGADIPTPPPPPDRIGTFGEALIAARGGVL